MGHKIIFENCSLWNSRFVCGTCSVVLYVYCYGLFNYNKVYHKYFPCYLSDVSRFESI